MAYNGGFPMTYQSPYYPQYSQPLTQPIPAQPQPQQNTGIIWVSGEAGAKAYMVSPNTTVQLWDSESQTIFLKSADASGMPSMKILDYTIRENGIPQQQAIQPATGYATKEELDTLKKELETLKKALGEE